MTMHELAFQNFILLMSGLTAIILIPLSLMNIMIQLTSTANRNRILQDYNEWRKVYNYQIIIFGGLAIYFLHPLVGAMVFSNIVIWFAGDFYHFTREQEKNNV